MSTTVVKALEILCLFLEEPEIGVSEAGRKLGLDKSTVSRLLATLEEHSFVVHHPTTRRYRLGTRVLQLAAALYRELDLRRIAFPVMVRLREISGETVSLQTRMGDMRVCVEQVPSRHEVRRVVEVGQPLPLHAGSSGKLLLASMSEEELAATLSRLQQVPAQPPLTDFDGLRQEIQTIRSVGYATSLDTRVVGISGISVPIRDYRGDVVAALAISGPSMRWTLSTMEACKPQLMADAAQISATLGHPSGAPGEGRDRGRRSVARS